MLCKYKNLRFLYNVCLWQTNRQNKGIDNSFQGGTVITDVEKMYGDQGPNLPYELS